MAPSELRVLRRSTGRLRIAVLSGGPDAGALEGAVRAAPGVRGASFRSQTGNLLVTFDAEATDEERVLAAVAGALTPRTPALPDDGVSPGRRESAGADVVIRDLDIGDGWIAAEGTCVVRAAPGRCVTTILDFAAYPDWQEYVTDVEVLDRDPRGRGSKVRTEARVGKQAIVHVMGYSYPSPTRIAWEQLEGQLDALRGEWRFRPAGRTATHATCRLEIRLGLGLRLMLNGPFYRDVRDMFFGQALAELRARAESPEEVHG